MKAFDQGITLSGTWPKLLQTTVLLGDMSTTGAKLLLMPILLRSLEIVFATSSTSLMVFNVLAFFTGVEFLIFLFTKLASASALYKKGKAPASEFQLLYFFTHFVNSALLPLSNSSPPIFLSFTN